SASTIACRVFICVVPCKGVQLLVDLLDPFLDVAAQPVDHGLVSFFSLLVFPKHTKKQVDVKHRPYPLLHGQLQELREVCFHGYSPPLRESFISVYWNNGITPFSVHACCIARTMHLCHQVQRLLWEPKLQLL